MMSYELPAHLRIRLQPGVTVRIRLQPGVTVRIHYPPNPEVEVLHVRGVVDGQYVVRRWSPRKGWRYSCESELFFVLRVGRFTIRKDRRMP